MINDIRPDLAFGMMIFISRKRLPMDGLLGHLNMKPPLSWEFDFGIWQRHQAINGTDCDTHFSPRVR